MFYFFLFNFLKKKKKKIIFKLPKKVKKNLSEIEFKRNSNKKKTKFLSK
jgi:hypothetical protein